MVVHTLNFAVIRMVWIRFGMPRLFRFLFVFLHYLHHIPFVDTPCRQIVSHMAEVGGKGKKACFEDLKFPTKPGENLLLYLHHFSVGDHLPMNGSQPPNNTNS
jgi:hypothetical protein